MKSEPPPHISDKDLPLVADVLDAIDPDLAEEERDDALRRAVERDSTAAAVLAISMLEGMIRSLIAYDPNVLKTIRFQAAALKEDPAT